MPELIRLDQFMNPSTPISATWPSGADGNLTVNNGDIVSFAPGTVKNYNNITINAGGKILVTDGPGWLILGCSGTFVHNGIIRGILGTDFGTFTATAPDGTALSYSNLDSGTTAGAGGDGDAGTGGPPDGNWAGGGAGNGDGQPGDHFSAIGGQGAEGFDQTGVIPGPYGAGGLAGSNGWDLPGDDALNANGAGVVLVVYGPGGGGGGAGHHGQGIYIKAANGITGSGTITTSGQPGKLGGRGGNAINASQDCIGGSGGGGGKGGNGGKVVIRYKTTLGSITITAGAGSAGAGGDPGIASGGSSSNIDGHPGNAGVIGTAGVVDTATY
jgi:hypothetical protein